VTDANGIVTKYAYNDAGLVTRMERLDGSETLTSLVVSYDGAGPWTR
jgi:YD repeat-containing protein